MSRQTFTDRSITTGRIVRVHVAIITKTSPHYIITESTISGRAVVLVPGLLPIDLSPRLRDKIWVGPGDEATFLGCCNFSG